MIYSPYRAECPECGCDLKPDAEHRDGCRMGDLVRWLDKIAADPPKPKRKRDRFDLRQYILGGPDGRTPIPLHGELWGVWFELANRIVKQENVGPYRISTCFLAIDHNFMGGGPPILFETMVFLHQVNSRSDATLQLQERCSTWDEAEAQHKRIAEYFRKVIES